MKIIWLSFLVLFLISCWKAELNIDIQDDEVDTNVSVNTGGNTQEIQAVPQPIELEPIENDFEDWRGEYYKQDNTFLETYGPSEEGGVDFFIWFEDDDCTGFSAIAFLEKSWVANYYDDETSCQINLTYNPGTIELSSYDCGDYEDAQCGGFSGIYTIK